MSQIVTAKWATAGNGNWANGGSWTPSGVPDNTAAFDYFAFLGGAATAGSNAFSVVSSANRTIGFLELGSNATLSITGGQFAIDSFLRSNSSLVNHGHLTVAAAATLSFGDTGGTVSKGGGIWNYGAAAINGTLQINAPALGLYGSGVLTLAGKIVGAATGTEKFVNHASTIQGSGFIGQGANLMLINGQGGVIDATGAAALTLNTGTNTISNAGVIRTDGAGGLTVLSKMQLDGQLIANGAGALRLNGVFVHGGGSISVGGAGTLALKAAQLSLGGEVSIAAGGKLTTTTGDLAAVGPGNALVGDVLSAGDVEDDGQIIVAANSVLNLNASVYGDGEIDLNAAATAATLRIFGTGSALYQSGGVVMSDRATNKIVSNGAGVQLSNSTKITGAGVIGDGFLRVSNSVLGTIAATGAAKLTIMGDVNAVAAGTQKENYNGGTISSTGAGGLLFSGGTMNNGGYVIENGGGAMTFNNFAIDGGGGVVQVLSGTLSLTHNSSIANQSAVKIANGATLSTLGADVADGLTSTVNNAGTINIVNNSTMIAEGHWSNAGTILLGSTAGATLSIVAGDSLQLFGTGGQLLMQHVNDKIVSAGAGAKLDNKTNLIAGAGVIGDANMTISNEVGGVIDANVTGGLTLKATAASGGTTYIYNAGTIQADTAAGVTITAAMYSPGKLIANSGSKIVAQSDVTGLGMATINGAASIEFGGVAQNDVYFGGASGGGLILDQSTQFTGSIFEMQGGDSIDLRDFHFVAGMTGIDVTQSGFGDASASIVLVNGTSSSTTLHLEGGYSRTDFQVLSDGSPSGGTLLKLT